MIESEDLHHTPLHELHLALKARMVPFAGYHMPVQYPAGIKQEHLHTRAAAGLFDVSHMGQVIVRGDDRAAALESLVPVDVCDLPVGRQRYALFTNDNGGVLDDLMITNAGDHLYLVVNAACKDDDLAHMQRHLAGCEVTMLEDRALLALQGPSSAEVLARHCAAAADMQFMDNAEHAIDGMVCRISRSGYTGEDGYEISLPAERAAAFAERLLGEPEVAPIGLGARDSLRLEAGLCLYGHELDPDTTPVEASLNWAISRVRRAGGAREGGFPGAGRILEQMREGTARRRVGILPVGRAPVRDGAALFDHRGEPAGAVTSGGFGPSVAAPIAMAYVPASCAEPGTSLFADVRGKRLEVTVAALPFTPNRFHRGRR